MVTRGAFTVIARLSRALLREEMGGAVPHGRFQIEENRN